MKYSTEPIMLDILILLILIICSVLATSSIIYIIIKSYNYKSPTLTLITPNKVVIIPLDRLHSITAVSQGQVLVTTILQEQFVGVLIKV